MRRARFLKNLKSPHGKVKVVGMSTSFRKKLGVRKKLGLKKVSEGGGGERRAIFR